MQIRQRSEDPPGQPSSSAFKKAEEGEQPSEQGGHWPP